jgi:integrase
LKSARDRYKGGYLRKVDRAKGFAWEFRINVLKGGISKTEYLTLSGADYPSEKLARQKLQSLLLEVNEGKAANHLQVIVFGTVIDRYIKEEMPSKSSTRGSYTSIIDTHIRPKWGGVALTEMKPAKIHTWLNGLALAPLTKGHVRSLLHKLFDLAQLWEYVELGRNPIELVKVKGVTKRQKEVVILTPEQAVVIIAALAEPYSLMVMTVAALGLRMSEMLGLQWDDIDVVNKVVTIKRSAYRGSIEEAKTKASHAEVPLPDELASLLLGWREKRTKERKEEDEESVWVFPNPSTGLPYQGPSIQQRWLRPAGEDIGMFGVGFHTFRHSHKTWLDSLGTPMGVMKDLLRHSNISVTMNVYGRTLSKEKRQYNDKVAGLLFPAAS